MARNELERRNTYTDDYFQYILNRQLSLNAGKRSIKVLSFQIWATEQVNRRLKALINKSKDVDENPIRYS